MKKHIAFLLCFILCVYVLEAQGRIDKVIDSLEGRSDVETTYTERRSPKKKKLIMTSRIFNFESSIYFDKLRKAFEEERANSISAVKTKNQMTYRFDNDKGVSTYTLSWTSDRGPFTMVMTWRSSDAGDSSLYMDDMNFPELGSGEFTMDAEELQRRLNCSSVFDSDDEVIIISNGKMVKVSAGGSEDNGVVIRTTDAFGCPVNMGCNSVSTSSSESVNKETAQARTKNRREMAEARAKVRKAAAEARQAAAKARREAAKAQADAHRAAAQARSKAVRAQRSSKSSSNDNSEAIYELASRSRCRIISSGGSVVESSALDVLDNSDVWKALEYALRSAGRSSITIRTDSGSKTTVIIEPEPDRI